ncbi:diguanylate cyclase [Cellvibrio sp. OA-2007]|uniref:diguanylate cyclase n=1 Tax=Cellvibrio sp. OA-2007 TaxID=529823 RepID=UPI000784C976|nr:diguanylate cyclase [Cellvibrio sp. OA-2007]
MKSNLYNALRLIAGLLTVMALFAQQYIPQKSLTIFPNSNFPHSIYGDPHSDGTPSAEWIDEANDIWRCNFYREDPFSCGYSLTLGSNYIKGIDLTEYDGFNIKIKVLSETQRLRIFFRNYNSTYDRGDPLTSAKFQSTVIRTNSLTQEAYVRLSEFSVAEWWINNFDVPREYAAPERNNVITFGFDFFTPGDHQIKIEKIEFVGTRIPAETFYLAILIIWMALIILEGLIRFYFIYINSKKADRKIEELQSNYKQLEIEKKEFEALSTTDTLTGVMNRAGINQFVEKLFDGDYEKTQIGLLVFDIDHFKHINDQRGHDAGDRILAGISKLITQNTRQSDVFGRWGGEEFVLVCPQTNRERLIELADKLRLVVSQHVFEPSNPLQVTMSIGATSVKKNEGFDYVFKRADMALYEAKGGGRNRVVYKTP